MRYLGLRKAAAYVLRMRIVLDDERGDDPLLAPIRERPGRESTRMVKRYLVEWLREVMRYQM